MPFLLHRPFGYCAEFLCDSVYQTFLIPIVVCVGVVVVRFDFSVFTQDKVIDFLDRLSDESLKKEATSEARSETFSSIMKVC